MKLFSVLQIFVALIFSYAFQRLLSASGFYRRQSIPDEVSTLFRIKCGNSVAIGLNGAEDFALTADNIVLISSGAVWPVFQPAPRVGKIFSLNLDKLSSKDPLYRDAREVELVNGMDGFISFLS